MNTDNLVTVRTYATLKGWSTKYVYDLIKANKIKIIKIDKKMFVIRNQGSPSVKQKKN